jgi:PIN domain nuclease of toxin-antitoxin system
MKPDRLSGAVTKVLADPRNELWLSPISVWELTLLCKKGRFDLHPDIPTWVSKSVAASRLTEAPFTIEAMLAIPSIDFSHDDPADHFLAATAKVFDLTLVTADKNLIKTPGIKILANR